MSIVESIIDYISSLDCMKDFNSIVNVNYLADEEDSFSIEEIPSEVIVKKYLDGSSKRQFKFVFTSREPYGVEVLNQLNNSNFYENFTKEIEENNLNNILPVLDNNLTPCSIKVISSAYLVNIDENNDTCMYQINLNFNYIKER